MFVPFAFTKQFFDSPTFTIKYTLKLVSHISVYDLFVVSKICSNVFTHCLRLSTYASGKR